MEHYFPIPKQNLLTGSILFFLATIVFIVMFYFFGNDYALVMIPVIFLTFVASFVCLSKYLAERFRQFLITYSLNISGFSKEISFHEIADYLIPPEKLENCILITSYPVEKAIAYQYKFPHEPQRDYIVIHDQSAIPGLGDYRVFVRSEGNSQ